MMILIIDNYDSFTYNLYQAVGTLTPSVQVVRNDSLTVSEAAALQPQAIILSTERRTTSNLTAPVRFLRIFRPSSREPVIIP